MPDAHPQLPRTLADLRRQWQSLPPTLAPQDLLDAGWVGLSRPTLYRSLNGGDIDAVRFGGHAWRIKTLPLLRQLGVIDCEPVSAALAGQGSDDARRPRDDHDEGGE
jgi:hypothetical protein